MSEVIAQVPNMYKVIPLKVLRRTPGVFFDAMPMDFLPKIDAIDRVIHEGGAISPGPIGDVERPWYMHTDQEDNLLVLHGTRYVDIYSAEHGKVESFTVSPNLVKHGDKVIYEGPAILVWSKNVFHRIKSDKKTGSASVNFAVHTENVNMDTNFSIYDLNTETGEYKVIREGHLDQPK
jgi:hypothetical protein